MACKLNNQGLGEARRSLQLLLCGRALNMSTDSPLPSPTDLELWHRIETEPEGTFRLFRADNVGTEERIQQHLLNIDELSARIAHAAVSGCVIEEISLRLQVIDFWLRVYFANRASVCEIREREFGRLLKQCLDLGLPEALYTKLKAFNKSRIDAIHGYVVGSASYEALQTVAGDSDRLLRDVVIFAVTNAGIVVRNRSDVAANPGAMVIHIVDFCAQVDRGERF
jgi:hypothetical protein